MSSHDDEERGRSNDDHEKADDSPPKRMGFRLWLTTHFTWSWFVATQSTGGVAALISECAKQFNGLQTIGTIVFIFDLVLFLTLIVLMVTRWSIRPSTFRDSFTNPPECYFFGSFWLSIATIIVCIERYGVPHSGPWLVTAVRVLFWIYAAATLLSTSVQHVVYMRHTPFQANKISPVILLCVYQAMLVGTVAASIAMNQPPAQRLPIMVAGLAYQGLGYCLSFIYIVYMIGSLLEHGWPEASQAPGLFMPVGVVGFTITVFIGLGRAAPVGYAYFAANPLARDVLSILGTWISIFLWVFGLWLFGIALFVCIPLILTKSETGWQLSMTYHNTWWAMIFPNVGFTLGTIYIGQELESNAIAWVSTIMVILVVAAWLLHVILMAKAVVVSYFVDSRIKFS